jgi:hypothetical protein
MFDDSQMPKFPACTTCHQPILSPMKACRIYGSWLHIACLEESDRQLQEAMEKAAEARGAEVSTRFGFTGRVKNFTPSFATITPADVIPSVYVDVAPTPRKLNAQIIDETIKLAAVRDRRGYQRNWQGNPQFWGIE